MHESRRPFRWSYLLMVATAVVASYAANACRQREEPARPFAVGLVTWIGYAPIYIASDRNFFAEEGIDVAVEVLDGPGAREAAYQAGELDFFPNTPDAFAIFFSTRPPKGKLVAGLDESEGADGIVAKAEIESIRSLRGKKVGFQSGITSHFLLLYLLERHGLSGRDVIQVDLSAGDAGQAFIAGKLDAAVTWEPWLSKARETPNAHVLATSAHTPGLIVDVLLASERTLTNDAQPLKAFMRAWFRGVDFIKTDPRHAERIIAPALSVTPPEVREMLKTTRFYTPEESARYLSTQLPSILDDANDLFFQNEVITTKKNLTAMIDASVAR